MAKETVKVIVRCRPLGDHEQQQGQRCAVRTDDTTVQLAVPGDAAKTFTFDKVFGPDSRQEDVYHVAAAPLVEAVLQGYTACIFAYGQTGCGKTHTMEGQEAPSDQRGIIPRAFEHIFAEIHRGAADHEYLVHVSHLEIYCEQIRDLLAKDPKACLELRESPERGVYVKGLRDFVVRSVAEMTAVLQVGARNRSTGATLMNQDSSRSHSIFTIIVETVKKPGSSGGGGGSNSTSSTRPASSSPSKQQQSSSSQIRVGKLHLVDLAGSERQSKTEASGERLREASKINLSLSALGNVIAALTSDGSAQQHIPYRDSKLTRLLSDSLGGNSKTVMVANIGPADYNVEETLSTLRYASRAKFIKNQPRINEDPKDAMLREFQEEIARLKSQLAERQGGTSTSNCTAAARPSRAASPNGSGGGALEAWEKRAAAIRDALRGEIEEQLKQEGSIEGLQQARKALEQQAQQRLAAEAASVQASDEGRQRIAAAIGAQQAELQAMLADIEAQQQGRLLLEQRIKAMESKLLRGGENLLTKVEELEATAAAHAEALTRQRRAQAEQERRLATLEEAASSLAGRYSGVAEEVAAKTVKLQRVLAATAATKAEAAKLAAECQAEREHLLENIRSLNKQISLKDMIIDAYIPQDYQQAIMSRCVWDDTQQRWAVERIEWAGNLVRARRQAEASLSGSESSSSSGSSSDEEGFGGRLLHIDCGGRLADALCFELPQDSPSCLKTGGSVGLGGRPRTAALQRQARPPNVLFHH